MKERLLTLEQIKHGELTEVRVVCSLCEKSFKPGEVYYGQVKGVFAKYVPGTHGASIIGVPASNLPEFFVLDYFHESCLR